MSFKLQKLNVVKMVETEDQKKKLISDGYELIEDEKSDGTENPPDGEGATNYSEMTVQDLQSICKENGLTGYSNLSKDDLVKFIQDNLKK
ncbi:Rho termination factor N-terminal domain-containing protein [uncultured Clostridium sp.]|uniref:Rho termination factor N-terminal domain-containing protein n=1 Tax=uncultured Clostridium sp. TaxID=59620 RepID=UPI0028E3D412|nr:Rho termination factor N-terminal domain-containing protein [uncultured Clostridium sp.]